MHWTMATSITFKEICNGRGYGDHILTIHGRILRYTKSGGYHSNPHTITSDINNIPEMFLKMLKIYKSLSYFPSPKLYTSNMSTLL